MTRTLLVLLLAGGAILAQEPAQLKKQAAELERRAETLLDAGRRPEALALIVQAADLRQKAREIQAAGRDRRAPLPPKETKKKKSKPVRDRAPKAGPSMEKAVRVALERFDRAVAAGDMAAALKEAKALRKQFGRWQKALAERQRKLAQPRPRGGDLESRLTALERELAALKRQLQRTK